MKAITLWQPWASLVALGVKTIETRSWATSYRGPIAIHAAKRPLGNGALNVGAYTNVTGEPIAQGQQVMSGPNFQLVVCPLGAIVATATLADVVPIVARATDIKAQRMVVARKTLPLRLFDPTVPFGEGTVTIEEQRPYGDFTPGRFAWLLEDVKPTTERCPACWGEGHVWVPSGAFATRCTTCDHTGRCDPIPAKGHQQLWEWAP